MLQKELRNEYSSNHMKFLQFLHLQHSDLNERCFEETVLLLNDAEIKVKKYNLRHICVTLCATSHEINSVALDL